MFGDKIKGGIELLTKATTMIEEGIKEKQAKIAKTEAEIAELQKKNEEAAAEIANGEKVVANFKKNILGE